MTDPINAFILAAGFGERLLPITNHIPKPLLPIVGKPVLEMILERLSRLHLSGIGINLHHKGDLLEDWISHSPYRKGIVVFPEQPILGTGGALKNAAWFLSKGTFLVHNGDILSDIDMEKLIDVHKLSGNLATLAVHDFPKFNNVSVDSRGLLKGVGAEPSEAASHKLLAFTGIAVYNAEFLRFLPDGASSVVNAWKFAKISGKSIGTHDVSGCLWNDMGTPQAYAAAVVAKMKEEGETVFIHPSVKGCRNAAMDGYAVVEKESTIGEGVSMKNCIAIPCAVMNENTSYEDCIVGADFVIPLAKKKLIPSAGEPHLFPIGSGGSDRSYFRVREQEASSVLMRFTGDDVDFQRQIIYTQFFRRYGVPVPALLSVDEERGEAVFEDLGDLSLYSWLKCRRSEDEIAGIYRKVIDIAAILHTEVTAHIRDCALLGERIFDYEHLRWETRYFMENFVALLSNLGVRDTSRLDEDFDKLARRVDSFRKAVIHRDFQSQNIMVARGGIPRIIDYQGARIGPPGYDIASLIWDPYYRLEQRVRDGLIDYYVGKMSGRRADFDERTFRESVLPCRLQRHMQALGAYAFLSVVKGKTYFMKHLKEGTRLLKEDASLAKSEYPAIYELSLALQGG